MLEAYSHEVSSCGYWPGPDGEGVFYSYAYPEPAGYQDSPVGPQEARYDTALGEFVAAVRRRAHGSGSRRDPARVPPVDVRSGSRPRRLGPEGPGAVTATQTDRETAVYTALVRSGVGPSRRRGGCG